MHNLCLQLGIKHPDYLSDLTESQIHDWCLFFKHYSITPDREDTLFAMVSMKIEGSMTGKTKEPITYYPYQMIREEYRSKRTNDAFLKLSIISRARKMSMETK